ncbi:MAG: hypothetical protein JXJ04_26410 [Spirochaetales bacterium]|nr:hypothetical protein [Spirochaetales bacterium]
MGIGSFFLHKLAEHYGLNNALNRIQASFNLGESSKIPMPKEIAAVSVDFASRGLLNMFAIQINLDWILPYWVYRQYNETSGSYVPGTVLSTNLTHRNWTAIGGLDSKREPIVDPTGLLTPWYDGWSTDFWVGKDDYLIVPSKNDEVYQYLVRQLPIVVSQFVKKDIFLRTKAFVYKHNNNEIICHSISLENLESKNVDISLFVNIRPYNPEGIAIINDIEYIKEDNLFLVNGKEGVFLLTEPDRIFCSNQNDGDTAKEVFSKRENKKIHCKHGLAGAFAEYRISLEPGEVKDKEIRMTTTPFDHRKVNRKSIHELSYQDIKRRVITEWEERLKKSITIDVPYQKIKNIFDGNMAHLYLFIDDDVVTPGPYTYHHEWFRDTAYMATALDKMGFHEETEKILLGFPARQKGDGYFVSQEGEWDSNGQAIWTYYQHYLYTRNKDFLRKIYDSAHKGVAWIKKNRVKESGLLPPGYSAEHFGPNDSFYWDNFWSLAGIRDFAAMARELGKEKDAWEAEIFYKDYYHSVFSSIEAAQVRFETPLIPSSPNRDIDSSIVGAISALYPLRIISPRDEKLTNTLRVLRRRYQQDVAFFHRVIHSGYNVYLTLQIAQCYLFRHSSRALPILQWVLDNITGTGTFPEAIHPVTKGGCMGDGHHGWACAEVLHFVRNLLFYEDGDGLIITPTVYHRWMEAGELIEVKQGPSYFGKINFAIESRPDKIILNLNNDYTQQPKYIEFSIPFFITKIFVDGKEREISHKSRIQFHPQAKEVVVFR